MRQLHNVTALFLLAAVSGAISMLVIAWLIIHLLPGITKVLDAVTGA